VLSDADESLEIGRLPFNKDTKDMLPNESVPNEELDDLPVLSAADEEDDLLVLEPDDEVSLPIWEPSVARTAKLESKNTRRSSTISDSMKEDLPDLKWRHVGLVVGIGAIAVALGAMLLASFFREPAPVANSTPAPNGPPAINHTSAVDSGHSVAVSEPSNGVAAPRSPIPSDPQADSQRRVASNNSTQVPATNPPSVPSPRPSPTLEFERYGARLGQPLDADELEFQLSQRFPRLSFGFNSVLQQTGSFAPLPPDELANSGLSWRVHLLPYLNQRPLYEQFHLEEPWDSPHNQTLIAKMPDEFRLGTDVGLTRFRVFTGPDMPFELGHTVRPRDLTDGEHTTALVFVVGPDKAVPWTKPDVEPFQPDRPLDSLGLGERDLFAALSAGGYLATGHIIRRKGAHPQKIAALATARGGELVVLNDWYDRANTALRPPTVFLTKPKRELLSSEQEHEQAREKLTLIGHAMKKQHAQTQRFQSVSRSDPFWRLLSWRVHLLPYLGHDDLYRQFHLHESWDSPHNLKLVEQMPEVFELQAAAGRTRFAVIYGDQLLFAPEKIASLSQITDDPATTAAVFYVAPQRAMIWTEPEWLLMIQDQPRKALGLEDEDPVTMLFANGDVTTLPPKAHPAKLFALATARGGEGIDLPTWFSSTEVAAKPSSATVLPPKPVRNAVRVPAPDPAMFSDTTPAEVDPVVQKLRLIGAAFFRHHDLHRRFSIPDNPEWFDKDGIPKLSWRVHLLPFLDQNPLYEKFRLNEPWDSDHNRPLLDEMPDVFRSASDEKTTTRFCVLLGEQTLFRVGKIASIGDIRDGSGNTILAAQVGADKAVSWTKPDDLPFDAARPLESFGNLGEQFHAVLADGRPLSIPTSLPPETFAALATAFGGEIIDADTLRRYAAHVSRKPLTNTAQSRALEQNKLKSILLAMQKFHDLHRQFPPTRDPKQLDAEGRPFLSWRVHLLRLLGQDAMFQQFRLDEPWDSPHNSQFLSLMPDVFRDAQAPVDSTTTRWMVFTGPNTPFPHRPESVSRDTSRRGMNNWRRDFQDGISNTILVIQAAADREVPWTKPQDLELDLTAPLECLGPIPAATGLLAGFADGSVRTITPAVSADQFKALVTPNGNEVIDLSILK
jgi:hypothetical protein